CEPSAAAVALPLPRFAALLDRGADLRHTLGISPATKPWPLSRNRRGHPPASGLPTGACRGASRDGRLPDQSSRLCGRIPRSAAGEETRVGLLGAVGTDRPRRRGGRSAPVRRRTRRARSWSLVCSRYYADIRWAAAATIAAGRSKTKRVGPPGTGTWRTSPPCSFASRQAA